MKEFFETLSISAEYLTNLFFYSPAQSFSALLITQLTTRFPLSAHKFHVYLFFGIFISSDGKQPHIQQALKQRSLQKYGIFSGGYNIFNFII